MAKPHVSSPEGIVMLALAVLFDLVDIILGFLDFLLIGLILSPIWSFIGLLTIGVWLWAKTGQELKATKQKRFLKLGKRVALPFIGNSIPLVKFFPFWVWSVWSALDKGASPEPEEEQQEQSPQPANQEQPTPAPA